MKFKWISLFLTSLMLLNACSEVKTSSSSSSVQTLSKTFKEKNTQYKKDTTTQVLVDKEVASNEIVSFYQHGDHWHVKTKKGEEFITYKNPELAQNTEDLDLVSVISSENVKDEVISIKRHGDHWHIYTANGSEFLTYDDPSSLYPHISIGEYVGNHGNTHPSDNKKNTSNASSNNPLDNIETPDKEDQPNPPLKIISILGKPSLNRHRIVKISKHGDHWHLIDDLGNEGLVYENPQAHYPHITIGIYEGEDHGSTSSDSSKLEWPEGITRIIDHGDHWHLYREDEEIAVVHENPIAHYPNAEVILEKPEGSTSIPLSADDLFNYEDIEAQFIESVLPYLSTNLKEMTHFGDLETTLPIYGSNQENKNIFYWLHGNHYHAISLKQIIQMAKAGEFGKHSAKEVVAVLKYKVLHPETSLEPKASVRFEEVQKFLMQYYNITEERDVFFLYGSIQVYKNGQTLNLSLSQFEKVNEQIISKIDLPAFNESSPETDTISDSTLQPGTESSSESPSESPSPTASLEEQKAKEAKLLRKVAQLLNVDEDTALDIIYEIIDDVKTFKLSDLEIHETDRLLILNGKSYPLILPED